MDSAKLILLLISTYSLTLLPDSHQSFLTSIYSETQDDQIHIPNSRFQNATTSNSSSSQNDYFRFLKFLNSKLVILEHPKAPNYLLPFDNSPILSNFLSNFCEYPVSIFEFFTLCEALELDLKDFSFLLLIQHNFSLDVQNFVLTLETSSDRIEFTETVKNEGYSPILVNQLLNLIETFHQLTITVDTTALDSLIIQQPLRTNSTQSLHSLLTTILSETPNLSPLFEFHYINTLLSQYKLFLITLSDPINTLPCNSLSTLYTLPEPCPAQEIANLIHNLRLSYPDPRGEIILNAGNLKTEILHYQELIHLLLPNEFVLIGDTLTDLQKATEDLQALSKTLEILESEKNVLIFTQGQTSYSEAKITNSEALSTNAYETIVEAFLDFNENVPIVGTGNFSQDILSKGTKQILVGNLNESFNATKANVNKVYQNDFIILTSFFVDRDGTGKIWVLPLKEPAKIYLLLEGFRAPVSVCFDPRHLFLYVVDRRVGKVKGSIFQYKLKVKKNKLELESMYYTKVYFGSPIDCKVDFYGNLYFTENRKDSIYIISFADLFSGSKNAYFAIYTYSEDNMNIRKPEKFVFSSSNLIFFCNGDNRAGSINYASSEVESLNELGIKALVNSQEKVQGIAYGDNQIFYALEGGKIWSYNLYTKSDFVISEGFFIDPQGLCFSDNKLYVADHGKGAVYSLDLYTKHKQLIASVQAVDGLLCLNSLTPSLNPFLILYFFVLTP